MVAGSQLTRADYFTLIDAGLTQIDTIEKSTDDTILTCFDGQPNVLEKLSILRDAVQTYHDKESNNIPLVSVIPPYKATS